MKAQTTRSRPAGNGAYMLMEALVYIGLVMVVLGAGFAVMYRCIDNSLVLRRAADDMAATLRAGERWRADIRSAQAPPTVESTAAGQVLRISSPRGPVTYRFETNSMFRQAGDKPSIRLLENVKSSVMQADARKQVTPWRWEVELGPRAKGYNKPGKFRPLFTFLAVPERSAGR